VKVAALTVLSAALVFGQGSSINGTITDPTGAVMPGVIVRLAPLAGGASFSVLTTDTGAYRFPSLAADEYRVRMEAPGFTPAEKTVVLLVGQSATIDLQLKPASTTTTVDVIASTTEVDVTSSQVGGNVDPQKMKDVPLNGRNWMELSLLVPGITVNAVSTTPLGNTSSGKFQINVDGQQVTQNSAGAGFGQPQYSREAMAQFQIITNRFDATLGRSSQIQVNAQTKSGTNSLHGSAYGYFRSDKFNAADRFAQRVLPFSNQQYGGTVGGAIIKDKLWFFGAFESERQPGTIFTKPLGFTDSFTFPTQVDTRSYLSRVDWQLNDSNKLSVRWNGSQWRNPFTNVGGSDHPSRASNSTRDSYGGYLNWTRVISPSLVNEVKFGYNNFDWQNRPIVESQEYRFSGISIGGSYNYPQHFAQGAWQFRDDLYWMKGAHSIKAGAEFMYSKHTGLFQQDVRGTVVSFSALPADLQSIFPVWNDPKTWKIDTLSPLASSFVQSFGNFNIDIPRSVLGFWLQDDWKISRRLTLNLGVRYDNDIGVFDGGLNLKSGVVKPTGNDNNNIAPRLGFAYDLLGDRKTVIRGGAGLYYADIQANQVIDQQIFNGERSLSVGVDRKGTQGIDLRNPFGGLTGADFLSGKAPVPQQNIQILDSNPITPYSFQASIGAERQLWHNWTISADFVHWRVYREWMRLDRNVYFNPATGFPANPTTAGRPDPRFTNIPLFANPKAAGAIYDGLQMELQRPFANNFTASAAYTLARLKDSTTGPFGYPNNQFDLNDEWGPSTDDQRHTLNFTASYQLPWGFQTSLNYHFGSGTAYAVTAGGNPFNYVGTSNRTFLTGTKVYTDPANVHSSIAPGYSVVNRNSFYGQNIHRLDYRITKTVAIKERYKIQGIAEAFNLLNAGNYGSYRTAITLASFGSPAQNANLAYAARISSLQPDLSSDFHHATLGYRKVDLALALNLKHPDADRLARELAGKTGESLTDAVINALRERLARQQQSGAGAIRKQILRDARLRLSKYPVLDLPPADEILGW
jgi:hypothetical protein